MTNVIKSIFKGFSNKKYKPCGLIIKKVNNHISDFFETPTRRLTVLHPTLCIQKKMLAKFVHNYYVEKVKKFQRSNVSRF